MGYCRLGLAVVAALCLFIVAQAEPASAACSRCARWRRCQWSAALAQPARRVHFRKTQSFYCYPRNYWWFYRPYTTAYDGHARCMPYFHYLEPMAGAAGPTATSNSRATRPGADAAAKQALTLPIPEGRSFEAAFLDDPEREVDSSESQDENRVQFRRSPRACGRLSLMAVEGANASVSARPAAPFSCLRPIRSRCGASGRSRAGRLAAPCGARLCQWRCRVCRASALRPRRLRRHGLRLFPEALLCLLEAARLHRLLSPDPEIATGAGIAGTIRSDAASATSLRGLRYVC